MCVCVCTGAYAYNFKYMFLFGKSYRYLNLLFSILFFSFLIAKYLLGTYGLQNSRGIILFCNYVLLNNA